MNIGKLQPHLIELLTPKLQSPDFEKDLAVFAERFKKIIQFAAAVSIPDNPLGNLHFSAVEVLSYLAMPIDPEQCLIHLNTFHRKKDLDDFLRQARELSIRYLLCVSGDGSQRLTRLSPSDLNIEVGTVTSVELLQYIRKSYGGDFICGVAFNQYEPEDHETLKLRRKIEAGAQFIITQPAIGRDERVLRLAQFKVPVVVGAWMSKRIDLLQQCLGAETGAMANNYDPLQNLKILRETYRGYGLYYSLLGFNRDWNEIGLR